jgi:hypothetical protein
MLMSNKSDQPQSRFKNDLNPQLHNLVSFLSFRCPGHFTRPLILYSYPVLFCRNSLGIV